MILEKLKLPLSKVLKTNLTLQSQLKKREILAFTLLDQFKKVMILREALSLKPKESKKSMNLELKSPPKREELKSKKTTLTN